MKRQVKQKETHTAPVLDPSEVRPCEAVYVCTWTAIGGAWHLAQWCGGSLELRPMVQRAAVTQRGGSTKSTKAKRKTVPKGEKPKGPGSKDIPPWNAERTLSNDPATAEVYGDLPSRYKDLPPAVAHTLIRSEITGTVRDLRLADVVPKRTPGQMVSGELADKFQAALDARSKDPTPMDFLEVAMQMREFPYSLRAQAAERLLAYKHAKKDAPTGFHTPQPTERGVLVLPADMAPDAWLKAAAEHHKAIAKAEKDS